MATNMVAKRDECISQLIGQI